MNDLSYSPRDAIFIHSLYRVGSTYLFEAFRRAEGNYWCYQEPANEFLRYLDDGADELIKVGNDTMRKLRHPVLSRPYFWEFYQIRTALSGLFRKSFSYDEFFAEDAARLSVEQKCYFSTLIANANGCPVLQCCRSAGRIGAFKQAFGGKHIHLWREPRNQWWSFKINSYFDSAVQLIYNARALPLVLGDIKHHCGIVEFHSKNIDEEIEHARRHPLGATANYFAFYALWLYAFLQGEKYADISISIDRLSVDEAYRSHTLQHLGQLAIDGLDFSDCAVPNAAFGAEEGAFFSNIEHQVRGLFFMHGYAKSSLDEAGAIHESMFNQSRSEATDLQRDAVHAREIAMGYLDQLEQAESRIRQAEFEVKQAELMLNTIYVSRSWHLTAPLRWFNMHARAFKGEAARSR